MNITTNIKLDRKGPNLSNVTIDKLFHFMIFHEINEGKCKVTIYTALAFHSDHKDARLIVSFTCNQKQVKAKHEDKSSFYLDETVIQQFWGKNSKIESEYYSITQNCINNKNLTTPDPLEKITAQLAKIEDTDSVLYIEEEKQGIEKIIIQPSKIKVESAQIALKCKFGALENELKQFISNGYWIKSEFDTEIESNDLGFKFKSEIKLDGAAFKSPDFKVYFQTQKKYDLKTSSSEVELNTKIPSTAQPTSSQMGSKCEVIKVFSQSKIVYFDEWAKLGIYTSSLFKVQMSNSLEGNICNDGIKSISINAQMEDLESPRKREITLLILSIIFSLFCSIGLDFTRQSSDAFKLIFPMKSYLSLDLLWSIVCIGILLKYLFITATKINKKIIIPLVVPLVLWFMPYAYISNMMTETHPFLLNKYIENYFHLFYFFDILLNIYCLLSYLFIKKYRYTLRSNKSNDRPIKNIFIKLTGT
ncbi:hypothetical protein ACEUBN_17905 [Aeromonas veronii]